MIFSILVQNQGNPIAINGKSIPFPRSCVFLRLQPLGKQKDCGSPKDTKMMRRRNCRLCIYKFSLFDFYQTYTKISFHKMERSVVFLSEGEGRAIMLGRKILPGLQPTDKQLP